MVTGDDFEPGFVALEFGFHSTVAPALQPARHTACPHENNDSILMAL